MKSTIKREVKVNEDGTKRVELRFREGGADFLVVIAKDGWDLKNDKKDGRFTSSRGNQVRISMNNNARFKNIGDFTGFVEMISDMAEGALEWLEENDKVLDLVWEHDGKQYKLPMALVEKQELNQEQVDAVKFFQKKREELNDALNTLDHETYPVPFKALVDAWNENEGKLQMAWGFDFDHTMQRWFNIPKCTCPKLDNEERLGTVHRIIMEGCPCHGSNNAR